MTFGALAVMMSSVRSEYGLKAQNVAYVKLFTAVISPSSTRWTPNFLVSLLCSFLGNFSFHSFSRTSLSVSVLQYVCYTYTVPFGLCTGTVIESPCFSVSLKRRI